MSYQGQKLRLKIGDGELVESFFWLEGVERISVSVQRDGMEATTVADGMWRALGQGMGQVMLSLAVEGQYRDSAMENRLRLAAFTGQSVNCALYYADGDKAAFAAMVTRYERQSEQEQQLYRLEIASHGVVGYTVA